MASTREILDIGVHTAGGLPGRCPGCCYWESDGAGEPGSCMGGPRKAEWIEMNLERGFAPGKVIKDGDNAIAYVQFSPSARVPRLQATPFPAPSAEAVYVTCIFVVEELRGMGLGRLLLESAARSLYKRKHRILETHGLRKGGHGPPGPASFFEACGFKVVSTHKETPLMRLDLRSLVPVQESIQSLLERLPLPSMARRSAPGPEHPCKSYGQEVVG